MFIPYSVDVPFDRKPVMNWLICALVLLAFFAEIATFSHGITAEEASQQAIGRFVLNGWRITGLFQSRSARDLLSYLTGLHGLQYFSRVCLLWPYGEICSPDVRSINPGNNLGED